MAGLAWSLINFGLLPWLPTELAAGGLGVGPVGRVPADAALIALPTIIVAALRYGRWSARGSIVPTLAGLVGTLAIGRSQAALVALLRVGSNALIAVLLPFAAERFPAAVRAGVRRGSPRRAARRAASRCSWPGSRASSQRSARRCWP